VTEPCSQDASDVFENLEAESFCDIYLMCEDWSSHSSVAEVSGFQECYAVLVGKY
jgi:hypothetical protein